MRGDPRRARWNYPVALVTAWGLWGCERPERLDPQPEAAGTASPAASASAPERAPWFVGTFRAEVPLVRLPLAPELRPAKKDALEPAQEGPPARAELTVRIDTDGLAHIELTAPFQQRTTASLEDGELRARFIPTPEALGSGTVLLKRSNDSFTGTLSLLDPERRAPLAGSVDAASFVKTP